MKIIIAKDYKQLSREAFAVMAQVLNNKPDAVIVMPRRASLAICPVYLAESLGIILMVKDIGKRLAASCLILAQILVIP